MKLALHILTPEGEVLKEEVDELIVPTVNGEIGVLPNHAALFTQILPGELRVKMGSKTNIYAITGGYLQIANNQVSILGESAVRAEDIEVAKAEEAKKRAENRMKEKVSQEDFAAIQGELRKAILQLKVARRHRTGRIQ